MSEAEELAASLVRSLPYIRKFKDAIIVIKYGGHAMTEQSLKESFAVDVVILKSMGLSPVIVHGGGPQIEDMLKRLKIESKFVDGLRVTDKETMDIVEMVLGGSVNKEIVSIINRNGGQAVGISGKDAALIKAKKLQYTRKAAEPDQSEVSVDMGMVGDVVNIDTSIIKTLASGGFIPVIAPMGIGDNGETFNINADTMAGHVAAALGATKFILVTDTPGVMDKNGTVISTLTKSDINIKISDGTITGGMIPKVFCCLDAIKLGVEKAHIIDGRVPHAILQEVFTESGIGTQIVRQKSITKEDIED